MLEVVITTALVAVALVGHLITTSGALNRSISDEIHNEGVVLAEQFIERLRSDEDWPTLYARLRYLQDEAGQPVPGAARLPDGRMAYPPQSYFPDFSGPLSGTTVLVCVNVPADPVYAAPPGVTNLREDVADARYGLPADLNADGAIGFDARDADYVVLPVRVTLQVRRPGHGSQVSTFSTWLRGER